MKSSSNIVKEDKVLSIRWKFYHILKKSKSFYIVKLSSDRIFINQTKNNILISVSWIRLTKHSVIIFNNYDNIQEPIFFQYWLFDKRKKNHEQKNHMKFNYARLLKIIAIFAILICILS